MSSDPARTAAIGHCMGGRLLIPFAADNPHVRAIVLHYPSIRDEPDTPHRPRHAFTLAKTLTCALFLVCGGRNYIATPAIQGPVWQSFIANGQDRNDTVRPAGADDDSVWEQAGGHAPAACTGSPAVIAAGLATFRLWERTDAVGKGDHFLQPGQTLRGCGVERERELTAAMRLPASLPITFGFRDVAIRHLRVPCDAGWLPGLRCRPGPGAAPQAASGRSDQELTRCERRYA